MDLAYALADIVISRAGALSISEMICANKACILVPSPNVAEDHQSKNAKALVNKEAAVLVTDIEASEKLIDVALELIKDEEKIKSLENNISQMAPVNATEKIVDEILKLTRK